MRPIDADALIPMMKYATTDSEIGVFPIKIGFNAITEVINNAPTVDAVPVIRCKDCKHRPHKNKDGYVMPPRVQVGVYAWGEPEYDDDESCPYVCEDRWYNSVPDDEQYCDRAEPKEKET